MLHALSCTSEDELYRTLTQLLFELQRPLGLMHPGDDDDAASVSSCTTLMSAYAHGASLPSALPIAL
jgi:hypothetical protein